ncbi:MAG: metallophosphoesterase [Gemmatimonadota bacterium]|nr:metallophosphoesterase [Gemmatimonadota bacterium]
MTVAHLSDLHLGYDGGTGGRGRAEDVLRAFEAAINRIAGLGPELVVIAGDVFDHPNVTAPPIAAFSRAVRRLRKRVPGVLVAVTAGARDTPLDPSHQGPLAVIGALQSVEAASTAVRRIPLAGGKVAVTLVPHLAARRGRALKVGPDSAAKRNVLVLHGVVADGPRARRSACRGAPAPDPATDPVRSAARGWAATVPLGGWDYVALGSRHTRAKVAARAHYSGSLERIGPDPWEEATVDKGFLTARLDTGAVRFWPVEARAAVSLAPVDAADGGTATAARRLSEALAGVPGGIDGKLLRIPVRGLCPEDLAALDRELLARVRRRVAELRVDALPATPR